MNFQTMNRQRKFILISAAVGIISVFLPWFTISAGAFGMSVTQNTNGFHGAGIVVFLCFLAGGLVSLNGDQTRPLDKTAWMIVLSTGVLGLICMVIVMIRSSDSLGGFGFVDAGYGVGIWISLIAAIAMPGAAFIFKDPAYTIRDGWEGLKKHISSVPENTTGGGTSGTSGGAANGSGKIAELERLIELKNQGKISEEEYQALKSRL